MIVVIDNYDSFTWNLVDLVRRGPFPVEVYRNDAVQVEEVLALNPKGILISPGPGRPADSGISTPLVKAAVGKIPILGVCLGHQLLGEMFGMELVHAEAPVHGKTSWIHHDGKGLFEGISSPMRVMRYHSLLLSSETVPDEIQVTARTDAGEIMGLCHKLISFAGVQFHPESILTESGDLLLANWLTSLEPKLGAIQGKEIFTSLNEN